MDRTTYVICHSTIKYDVGILCEFLSGLLLRFQRYDSWGRLVGSGSAPFGHGTLKMEADPERSKLSKWQLPKRTLFTLGIPRYFSGAVARHTQLKQILITLIHRTRAS